jgi:hypothetical protein
VVTSVFELIREDFVEELDAIRELVTTFDGYGRSAKTRIAAANSATLLVAATLRGIRTRWRVNTREQS